MIQIINVTTSHIATGIRRDCNRCPIALAIREQTPYKRTQVGNDSIDLMDDYGMVKADVPTTYEVNKFVKNFDGQYWIAYYHSLSP